MKQVKFEYKKEHKDITSRNVLIFDKLWNHTKSESFSAIQPKDDYTFSNLDLELLSTYENEMLEYIMADDEREKPTLKLNENIEWRLFLLSKVVNKEQLLEQFEL